MFIRSSFACAGPFSLLSRRASACVPQLNADLNSEWNPRLSRQQLIRTKEFGEIVHQEYSLPWPLAPRHMLMKCSRDVRPKASTFKSSCHSVEHDSIPLSRDAVRVHLSSTSWEIRALPNEQTHIRLRLELPEQMATGVPSFVVNYAQDSSLRDSVNAFMSTVSTALALCVAPL